MKSLIPAFGLRSLNATYTGQFTSDRQGSTDLSSRTLFWPRSSEIGSLLGHPFTPSDLGNAFSRVKVSYFLRLNSYISRPAVKRAAILLGALWCRFHASRLALLLRMGAVDLERIGTRYVVLEHGRFNFYGLIGSPCN